MGFVDDHPLGFVLSMNVSFRLFWRACSFEADGASSSRRNWYLDTDRTRFFDDTDSLPRRVHFLWSPTAIRSMKSAQSLIDHERPWKSAVLIRRETHRERNDQPESLAIDLCLFECSSTQPTTLLRPPWRLAVSWWDPSSWSAQNRIKQTWRRERRSRHNDDDCRWLKTIDRLWYYLGTQALCFTKTRSPRSRIG
jgi:hypothetical protein